MLLLIYACSDGYPSVKGSKVPDHSLWTTLLKKHVSENGLVDYRGFLHDSLQLYHYLNVLKQHPPDKNAWSNQDQMAYWINVYNAFTVDLVLKHYPLASIKDITKGIEIPFVHSPWDIKFINIAGQQLDLNDIEHNILRKRFHDTRIHFAVNCAALSCPKLRREAYNGAELNRQLDQQAADFINDPEKNIISTSQVSLSRIYLWYRSDFTRKMSLIDFLNQYSKIKISHDAEISYLDYNWNLNETENR